MAIHHFTRDMKFIYGLLTKRPFDLCFQVTNRCNMKCSFCNFWCQGSSEEELVFHEIGCFAQDLSQLGNFIVSLEGGEPTLRDDLPDIVELFARDHYPVVYTNGWTMSPSLAEALFKKGMHQIGVSLDFPDEKRHDQKRDCKGAHQRAIAAIEMLRDRASRSKKQVHIMTILMEDNQDELEEMLRISQFLEVGHHFTLLSPNRKNPKNAPSMMPTQPVGKKLLALREKYPQIMTFSEYLMGVDHFIENSPMPTCKVGNQLFNVQSNGAVTPCNDKLDWISGNIKNRSIVQIHRNLLREQRVSQCQDCWLLCRGFSQYLGNGGSYRSLLEMFTRMKV